jgi:hypothetical protein
MQPRPPHCVDVFFQKNATPSSYATPRDIGNILYATNADFRRYHIVLNWLEELSAVPVESSREKVSWRTREIIKRAQVTNAQFVIVASLVLHLTYCMISPFYFLLLRFSLSYSCHFDQSEEDFHV